MKIYHNSIIVAILKRFIPYKGSDFLNRLIGIDLQDSRNGEINVYPVYRSWRFRKTPKGLLIEIPIWRRQWVILISKGRIYHQFVEESQLHLSDVGTAGLNKNNDPKGEKHVRL